MTTIAANRKEMAADRKVTTGDTHYSTIKIYRVGKEIIGCSGHNSAIFKLLRWIENGRKGKRPEMAKNEQIEGLILTRKGLVTFSRDLETELIADDFYAIGSGRQAALAAMHCGKTPAEAVEVACLVDNHTRGPVDVMEV
jgi:ATP-dependent protease HslVU (ClpYQ) peptidase subunit